MKNIVLTFLAAFTFLAASNAQLTKGKIVLEVQNVSSDDESMQMAVSVLQGSVTNIYFDTENSLAEMLMMGGMISTKNYTKTKTGEMNTLMDAMGSKIWVKGNINDKKTQQQSILDSLVISYDEKDTKEILGYKAYKVTIQYPKETGMSISGYITEDIKSNASVIQGAEGLNLKGFPLEFTVKSDKLSMSVVTKEINDKIDASIFTINTEGYQKMSYDEFSKSLGGASLGF